jgi:hypothetical protein
MYKNFVICPHCEAKGKKRSVQPATAHRSPLVSRSDAKTFHIFLEESYVRPNSSHAGSEVVGLFRYDLDSAGVKGESTFVLLTLASGEANTGVPELEKAADDLAEILALGRSLPRQFAVDSQRHSFGHSRSK